jgi:hypothetical protein
MRQALDARLGHTLPHFLPRQSSISKSEDIVIHNRKNGRIKQEETEMGIDGPLDNLQWLPLHYNWLRSRPHGPVTQAWLSARPMGRRRLSHTAYRRACHGRESLRYGYLIGVYLLGVHFLQVRISLVCASHRRVSLGMGTLQACISWACVSYRRASLWHLLSMHLYRGTSLTASIS